VEEITKAATAPNVLNVAIPMNLPVSQVLPKINELVETLSELESRLKQFDAEARRLGEFSTIDWHGS
jgi:hypothetical protein